MARLCSLLSFDHRCPRPAQVARWLAASILVCACSSSKGNAGPANTGGSNAVPDATGSGGLSALDASLAGDEHPSSFDASTANPDASTSNTGVRWLGRVDLTDPTAPKFAWSASGLVATVAGPTISVKLKTVGSSDPIFFQPVIDGTPGARFSVVGEQTIQLAAGLPDADHLVEVYRDTEGRYGYSVYEGFVDGTLKGSPAASGRRIEIVGDSISAGYGNLGAEQHPNYGPDPDGGCHFATQTESAYATYGALAARALNADVSIVAVSGWGIYRDNGNSTANVMPNVYAHTLGLAATPAWSFQPEPQAVVINLGTNDFATGDPGATPFEGAYSAFIATVRGKYPNAWIFCTVGPLLFGTGLASAITDIQAVVANANDPKVKYLDFGQQNTTLGTGCDYHPNVTEQQAMANVLAPAIRSAVGW